jgi:sigma-E factor negative regulatory protein RseA
MKEKLSALLDGDVDADLARFLFDRLGRDPALREDWETWCLIGDAVRGEARYIPGFVAGVMSRLGDEPTVLAPPRRARRISPWQWALPVAASVMGVLAVAGVVATLSLGEQGKTPVTPRLASSTPVKAAPGDADVARREYLFAHQAMAGGGPVPAAVQYVRTVSAQAGE